MNMQEISAKVEWTQRQKMVVVSEIQQEKLTRWGLSMLLYFAEMSEKKKQIRTFDFSLSPDEKEEVRSILDNYDKGLTKTITFKIK